METIAGNKSDISEANTSVSARAFPVTTNKGMRKHCIIQISRRFLCVCVF